MLTYSILHYPVLSMDLPPLRDCFFHFFTFLQRKYFLFFFLSISSVFYGTHISLAYVGIGRYIFCGNKEPPSQNQAHAMR